MGYNSIRIFKTLLFVFILLPVLFGFSTIQNEIASPNENGPVEVSVTLRINKIYNINTVDETYQVDGYLLYSWKDERMKFISGDSLPEIRIYENAKAEELINSNLWYPACELINIQGARETPNKNIEIRSDGKIVYTERFFGTFHSQMNYKRFPFDSQKFVIFIEAFSYDETQFIFKDPKQFPVLGVDDHIGEDWDIISVNAMIEPFTYAHLQELNSEESTYSRAVFEVEAKRLSGYYLWQVLFPLFIIILASFTIFWIKEFNSQIAIGFTLMLTVVAFNFYSASILPKLPYNTFIEYVIIVGYIFIFLGIIGVIVNHRVNPKVKEKPKYPLLRIFQYCFPISYIAIMLILYLSYLA